MENSNKESRPALSKMLEQGYRESWELYRRSLGAPPGVWPQWDWIVLTAANERQAESFDLQIERRRRAGLLPQAARFLVVADPRGRRIGSGGATVNALAEVLRRQASLSRRSNNGDEAGLLNWKRILILHSGGESRRLPHCSAFGKIFARVPRELPDGRPSTLFDEFLISLSGLPYRMHEGVFVASGDVLLLFDHGRLDLSRQGIVGIAATSPAELGTRHGVFVAAKDNDRVRRFLHKQTLDQLQSAGAVDPSGRVAIDTGLVWFDPSTVCRILALFGLDDTMGFGSKSPFAELVNEASRLNLYGDLMMPLAEETSYDAYVHDDSDGIPGPAVRRLRPLIWESLRDVPFHVQSLSPVEFIHFGTTAEYLSVMTEGLEKRSGLGWNRSVAACCGGGRSPDGPVLIGSSIGRLAVEAGRQNVVEDCCISGPLALGDRCVLSHVWTDRSIATENGVVLHQLPVVGADDPTIRGYVTRIYGIDDNPKIPYPYAEATFLNRPWKEWLTAARVRPEDIWAEIDEGDRSLWNARLYPFSATREESLELALWMQNPDRVDEKLRNRWLVSRRLSLGEAARRADVLEILEDVKHLDDRVRVQRFCQAVERERPSREALVILGDVASDVRRRAAAAAKRYAAASPSALQIRGYKAIADALSVHSENKTCRQLARRYEDRAFAVLARLIRDATPRPRRVRAARARRGDSDRTTVVEAPARIDVAGGWSDTPPFSMEYGGKVLNAAVRVKGRPPIRVECERLEEPVLVFESADLGVSRRFSRPGDVLKYADPSDPLALHKAGAVLAGLVASGRGRSEGDFARRLERMLGGGLRIATRVALPHGSGLGTSSILAGALLTCLKTVLGRPVDYEETYDEVLCLEQMLTTGGGWQDQIGGMVGGIKLSTTRPGLPQRPHVAPIELMPETAREIRQRLVLVYTGQRRLAKGILRSIMGQFMSRDPEVVGILCEIRDIAEAQKAALESGDLDEVGRLMTEHWEMNKRMDPGTTNPFIDHLFDVCSTYSCGGKLAGAGGGGFMMLIARDEEAPARLKQVLAEGFPETDVAPWPCEIAYQSLLVQTLHAAADVSGRTNRSESRH